MRSKKNSTTWASFVNGVSTNSSSALNRCVSIIAFHGNGFTPGCPARYPDRNGRMTSRRRK
jgi:alkyl hydroperoxide reductase subunit AhpC